MIVVAGSLAQRPWFGGHATVFLQWLVGLGRLGHDVLFVDHLAGAEPRWVHQELHSRGIAYAILGDGDSSSGSVDRAGVLRCVRDSLLVLNINGFLDDEELLGAARRRVFLDIDPGFGQMWRELGLADVFAGHDAYVTIGERIGAPDAEVPTCGLEWITTRQPVVLDEWPMVCSHDGRFTSVGAWRGPFGPIEYRGKTYGLRVHEFRKFAELPRRTRREFEIALAIDPADERDVRLLREHGWVLADPAEVARDSSAYRDYIQRSKAEFMVAKNMYVETRSGWFSDRSLCYLASGKPVLAQDTGISELYPTGEGLLTFSTLDEAIAGVEEIHGNYGRHCKAAREIAESYFESDVVLARLLEKLGVA